MPSREHGLERHEETARHWLTVVMEEVTGCRERHEIMIHQLQRWLRCLNRAGHQLLSDLEREIDCSLPESAWLWTAIEETLTCSRQIVDLRRRIIADGSYGELSGELYAELQIDASLKAIQETVSEMNVLIPRNTGSMPEAYGEG